LEDSCFSPTTGEFSGASFRENLGTQVAAAGGFAAMQHGCSDARSRHVGEQWQFILAKWTEDILGLFCLGYPPDHGSLNVPIEHHPTIRYMVYNGYYKVMSNIRKMGQLPTPE